MIDWTKYLSAPPTMKPNKKDIPVNMFTTDPESMEEWNEIYRYCFQLESEGKLHRFVMTPSTGISIKRGNIRGAMWTLQENKSHTMSMIILRHPENARYYKFKFGYTKDKSQTGAGYHAYQTYVHELKKDGVDLTDLALTGTKEENELVKKTIPKAKIECRVCPRVPLNNCHHIDLNSAFQAGMSEAYPILRPTVERLFALRKTNPVYKDILNMTQGFFQSEMVSYKYSHISKAGYEWTNNKLQELTLKLTSSGRRIVGYNTDGIWYQGDIYHDEGEGTQLGQWKNDHQNCKLRYKSPGCYEFIENGKYYPVFRGTMSYELEKPRELWEWGDIFKGEEIKYQFITGYGWRKAI